MDRPLGHGHLGPGEELPPTSSPNPAVGQLSGVPPHPPTHSRCQTLKLTQGLSRCLPFLSPAFAPDLAPFMRGGQGRPPLDPCSLGSNPGPPGMHSVAERDFLSSSVPRPPLKRSVACEQGGTCVDVTRIDQGLTNRKCSKNIFE